MENSFGISSTVGVLQANLIDVAPFSKIYFGKLFFTRLSRTLTIFSRILLLVTVISSSKSCKCSGLAIAFKVFWGMGAFRDTLAKTYTMLRNLSRNAFSVSLS